MTAASITITIGMLFFLITPAGASDGAPTTQTTDGGAGAPSIFSESKDHLDLDALHVDKTLRMDGRRLDSPIVRAAEIMASRPVASSGNVSRKRRTIISVICSAILPGLGELYLYRETRDTGILARVPFFFAAEGYLWYSYIDNRSEGKDIKEEYMDFADQHWSLEQFLALHPCCAGLDTCDSWQEYNAECRSEFNYFLYTPREMDEEEYYENIGKYEAFAYGWDDWNDQPDYWTPNRTYYWSLRQDSNKYLLRADQRLMLLIVNRIVSMVDAGLLAYRMGGGRSLEEQGWSIELEPGREVTMLNLCYRF
jgi:hypothetical protein